MSQTNKTKVYVFCEAARDGLFAECKNFALTKGAAMNGGVPCRHSKKLSRDIILCTDNEATRDALLGISPADVRRARSKKMEM
jgi:hypothetical protein